MTCGPPHGPPPPEAVLTAFGLRILALALPGGQGRSWRVGETVLKPFDGQPIELDDLAALLARVEQRADLRVSPPRRARDGSWVADGWSAWRHEPGRPVPGSWVHIVDVGRHLHEALRDEPDLPWRAARTDSWAVADRMAWGELDIPFLGPRLAGLLAARRPVAGRAQLARADLTGNVLFDEHLPPVVIDFSLYWRPPEYASAVVVADALVFEEAGPEVIRLLGDQPDDGQYLLRALLFRAVTARLRGETDEIVERAYGSAADAVLSRLRRDGARTGS